MEYNQNLVNTRSPWSVLSNPGQQSNLARSSWWKRREFPQHTWHNLGMYNIYMQELLGNGNITIARKRQYNKNRFMISNIAWAILSTVPEEKCHRIWDTEKPLQKVCKIRGKIQRTTYICARIKAHKCIHMQFHISSLTFTEPPLLVYVLI